MKTKENPQAFTPAQNTLFALLAQNLFGQPAVMDEAVNWADVYRESYAQAVFLPAFQRCQQVDMPEELRNRIKTTLRRGLMRDTVIHSQHTYIHTLLTQHQIPYTVLKGAASAYYYPDPCLRSMGDVDFFVPESYIDRADALLQANGFVRMEAESDHHIDYTRKNVRFELHGEIPGVPKGVVGETIRQYRTDLTEKALPTHLDFATFNRPAPFHHGLILLLHTQEHLLNEGLGLRHVCDWAVFVHSFEPSAFVAMFREKLEAVGLWCFARILSLAAVKAVGLPMADWMLERDSERTVAEELLADVLSGGNFGYKDVDRERSNESKLISNSKKSELGKNRIGNAIESMNNWVRLKWRAAEKCPLLLPFGWVWFFFRRLWLVATGKRKSIKLGKTIRNSGKRQNLYRQLRLFQPKP